jgi:hypothetical protein
VLENLLSNASGKETIKEGPYSNFKVYHAPLIKVKLTSKKLAILITLRYVSSSSKKDKRETLTLGNPRTSQNCK